MFFGVRGYGTAGAPDAGGGEGTVIIYEILSGKKALSKVGPLERPKVNGVEEAGGAMGRSVAMASFSQGTFALAGAPLSNQRGTLAGRVYIYKYDTKAYSISAVEQVPDDLAPSDNFGAAVAVDGLFNQQLVGAPRDDDKGTDSGSAYVFERSPGDAEWSQVAKLTSPDAEASGDNFGTAVAISDGTAVVGAPNEDDNGTDSGSVHVFRRSTTNAVWTHEAELKPADGAAGDMFGSSVCISGERVAVGAPGKDDNGADSGAAYVFVRSGTNWSEGSKLGPSVSTTGDMFGSSVCISGERVVVGGPGDDAKGADSGSAWVFETAGASAPEATLSPADLETGDRFGTSVSIGGGTVVVGAPNDDDKGTDSGAVYFFKRSGSDWGQQAKLIYESGQGGDKLGASVSIDEDSALVGAPGADDNGADAGIAILFQRQTDIWGKARTFMGKPNSAGAGYGCSVSVSGKVSLIGACFQDTSKGSDSGAAWNIEQLEADLQVTKSVSPGTVAQGGTVFYTISVVNSGPSTATNVKITDTLPSQVALVSSTPSTGSCSTGPITCSLGDLASGDSATVTIEVVVNAAAPSDLVNTGSATSDIGDPDQTNNTANTLTLVRVPEDVLTFVKFHKDGVGGVDGLDGAISVTVSPDGRHLYAAGRDDDTVAVFSRNSATGALSFVEVKRDGVDGVDGLDGAFSVTVSPDGKHLYAVGAIDDAVAVFSRNATTGALTFVEAKKDGVGGVDRLDGTGSVTVTPDGKHLFVAGATDNAVAVLSRDSTTGQLAFVEVHKDGVGGVDGLADAASVTVSPDGKHLYAAGATDDAVAEFRVSDLTAPTLAAGDVIGTTIAGAGDTIVLTFSEEVQAVDGTFSSNEFTSIQSPDGTAITLTNASFSRSADRKVLTITLDETADNAFLTNGNIVAVTPATNAIRDLAGTEVVGTTNITGDTTAPTLAAGDVVGTIIPIPGADDTIVLTFSEEVQAVDGTFSSNEFTSIQSPDGTAITFTNASFSLSADKKVLTITLNETTDNAVLTKGNIVTVTPAANAIKDLAGNSLADTEVVGTTNITARVLTFVEVQRDGVNGVDGLASAYSVTVCPDGSHLYAVGLFDAAVAVFSRDSTTGALTFVEVQRDGVGVVDGLRGAISVTVSPDGKHLYAAGNSDNAVAVFSRHSTTGALTFVEVQRDGSPGGVDGLAGAISVTVSPDGKHLYAAGFLDNAVAVFSRNSTTGALTFVEVQRDGARGVDGLDGVISVTVSPDRKHLYAAGATDNAVAVFSLPRADLSVTKSVDDSSPREGEAATFTVTVTNNGPGDATGVVVGDVIPSGLTFQSAAPSDGAYSTTTGSWTLASSLASGDSATLTLVATAAAGTDGATITNTATVTASDQADPDAGNNSDSAAVTVGGGATTGTLTFVEFHKDGLWGVDGLFGAHSVTVSPDGKHIYAASLLDDAVAVFSRNSTTGALTFVEFHKDGVAGVDRLDGAFSVTVSPDGKHIYAAGQEDSAVAVFSRDSTTGKLTFVEFKKDSVAGVDGLAFAQSVTVSPDGKHLYAAGSDDNTVGVFSRNSATGRLTLVEVKRDGVGGVDGLESAVSVTVSPDGKHLYAVGSNTVAVFSRDSTTGKLTFMEFKKDGVGGVDGLGLASSVTVSPDGRHLYATSFADAVAVFSVAGVTLRGHRHRRRRYRQRERPQICYRRFRYL